MVETFRNMAAFSQAAEAANRENGGIWLHGLWGASRGLLAAELARSLGRALLFVTPTIVRQRLTIDSIFMRATRRLEKTDYFYNKYEKPTNDEEDEVEEDELEDPRMELVRQLLEYKKFKERAMLLEKRLDQHRRRHRRPPVRLPAGEEIEDPLNVGSLTVWDLLTAFHKIQIALGQRGPIQFVVEDRPIGEYINDVVEQLESAQNRTLDFESLFTPIASSGGSNEVCVSQLIVPDPTEPLCSDVST